MPFQSWLVGRNLHTNEWESGGRLSDYPREHYEVYRVAAARSDEAIRSAQQLRSKARSLTPNQQAVLRSVFHETDSQRADPCSLLVELEPSDLRAANALAKKGLFQFEDESQVRLTFNALNFRQS